ncbi:hypothetical protein M2404_004047 [Rheinheimera pacifica]|uniref:conjugal transfer protein TraP n=1 Tax=Rheinheimera pacifica TaxID=173990 RepID=UPI0021692919|nr:conjugal transfer protein TraP [Rheinheimera pacifica]MCS4309670.1 hypothetical protein [Rheinheimera pacifica]
MKKFNFSHIVSQISIYRLISALVKILIVYPSVAVALFVCLFIVDAGGVKPIVSHFVAATASSMQYAPAGYVVVSECPPQEDISKSIMLTENCPKTTIAVEAYADSVTKSVAVLYRFLVIASFAWWLMGAFLLSRLTPLSGKSYWAATFKEGSMTSMKSVGKPVFSKEPEKPFN